MRSNISLLAALSLPATTSAFVVQQNSRPPTRLHGCTTTWSDYKTQHLDSLTDTGATLDLVHFDLKPDATLSKAANSRAYWYQQVQSEKQRLHSMKPLEDAKEWSHPAVPAENWVHYRKALEALVPHHHSMATDDDAFHWPKHASSSSWSDYMEMVGGLAKPEVDLEKKQAEKAKDEKQYKADAFWQAKYKDDKEKQVHHATEEAETTIVGQHRKDDHLDTWGHYKHQNIDVLPPQKSIEQELEELRHQAAQFKALALAETVGHTLAEEALHEAEERAASCEIAEAVLIGAVADGGRPAATEKEEGGAGM